MDDLLYLGAATMRHAVTESIRGLTLTTSDTAVAVLAYRLAGAIDDADDQGEALKMHGPKLLDALKALRATPATRPAPTASPAAGGSLQALREGRG